MYKLSILASALGLASLASGQSVPIELPEFGSGDSGANAGNCGQCYVIADVAGVAFGTETLTGTATQSEIVTQGRNGTFTTTSLVFDEGQFTINESGVAPGGGITGSTAYNTDGTTLVLNGVTLTSPTAYNVFTAYSVTSQVFTNGACSVVAGPKILLSQAFSVPIPSGVDMVSFASVAERSFVSNIGSYSCLNGGENYVATTHVPVDVTTTSVTSTASAGFTPQPAMAATTAATTTGPTATFIPGSIIANGTRTTYLPGGTGTIVVGTQSIMYAGANRVSTVGGLFAGVVAFVAGIVA